MKEDKMKENKFIEDIKNKSKHSGKYLQAYLDGYMQSRIDTKIKILEMMGYENEMSD